MPYNCEVFLQEGKEHYYLQVGRSIIIRGAFMKRFVPISVLLLVLPATLAVVSVGRVNGQAAGLVSSVLNRMERNRQNLSSLRAGISMEKYNAQLRDADKYNGTVLYVPSGSRDASVRIEWRSPQHEILAVSKGKYTLFRPRLKNHLETFQHAFAAFTLVKPKAAKVGRD